MRSCCHVAAYLWGGLPWANWLTPEADGLYHTPADAQLGRADSDGTVARMATNIVVGLAANSMLAAFEEIGWRAWMLPRLMERMSVQRAVTVSAMIWAFWHTPFALGGIHYLPGIPVLLVVLTLADPDYRRRLGDRVVMGSDPEHLDRRARLTERSTTGDSMPSNSWRTAGPVGNPAT